jgi:predicted RNA-binding protein YlxR (DUF448 family)
LKLKMMSPMKKLSKMSPKKIPLRKCVACQEMTPKKSLIRVVRSPESEIKLDPTGKASGRGAYICTKAECFALARKKNAFERALKSKIADEVYQQLEEQFVNLGVQHDK